MLQNIKKRTEGFTIIEVLIVLAIAGLIMMIVFLAVPALRRNQQNATMKSEASRVLTLATEYESNSNGAQVSTQALFDQVYASAGALQQLTGAHLYGAGAAGVAGSSRLVIGTCTGTVATAAAGRTYAIQYVLNGGQQACIQS